MATMTPEQQSRQEIDRQSVAALYPNRWWVASITAIALALESSATAMFTLFARVVPRLRLESKN
jgi:hypothetical protein